MPALEELELCCCGMNLHDYKAFVLKHIATLKSLHIMGMLVLHHGSAYDLGRFYEALRESQMLEDFHQTHVFADEGDAHFPSHHWCPWDTKLDEHDYVNIVLMQWIVCEGRGT